MADSGKHVTLVHMTLTDITPTHRNEAFEEGALGMMADCTPMLNDMAAMRRHLSEKGYVYLPQFHDRERVLDARRVVIDRLASGGVLDERFDPMQGILREGGRAPGFAGGVLKDLFPNGWEKLHDVLYTGRMMNFFRDLHNEQHEEEVVHYDFTWLRLVNPGPSTAMHADVVYMGRGTNNLHTVWTPWGDNGFDLGGLVLLEGSNRRADKLDRYWHTDVDAFCENKEDKSDNWNKGGGWIEGSLKQLRDTLGGRWVTADYRAGDIVVFHVNTVHGGTDNQSNKVRISSDTRFQKKADAIDERWIGEKPIAHGPAGKRGMIC